MRAPGGGVADRDATGIHPSAVVDPDAHVGPGVTVGPFAVVGPGVVLGAGTRLGPHVHVERDTELGEGCRVSTGAVLGTDPQDLKYRGEPSRLVVGAGTVIREYATLNRGTMASGCTVVGRDCLLMAYTHVAHDCELGDRVILANSVNMAGHVQIGHDAVVGGLTPIHQFVRIGAHAFVGGGSRISQDVPPFCRVAGNPPRLYGLNAVGLRRRGFSEEVRTALKRAYRLVFRSGLTVSRGVARAAEELPGVPEVAEFLDFIRGSPRGVTT
ncbi:MAG: acyl-ACP--UDP-N-acetylglucosamine O-acyltransferase [Longimicrobiales bacterium]|nr:acyl-ACP--UDP-N-acetylglucosamine O-acyltransferase [Longimicrobiales bacterium]